MNLNAYSLMDGVIKGGEQRPAQARPGGPVAGAAAKEGARVR